MGFPPILSALQTFQICIFNTKNSKLTFSNGSQLMGKTFMANLHASLDSICKSRISKISTRCENWEVHSTTFDPELRNELKNFSNPREHPFHNFWSYTQKWTLKFFQSWGGSIPKLLILNSVIKVWHWYLLWGFLQYWVHYRHFKSAFSIQKIVN